MSKILNLEKLVPDDRFILIGGKRICVPGNISVLSILEITKTAQNIAEDQSSVWSAFDKMWGILAPHNPAISKEEFYGMISPNMLKPLFEFIGSPDSGEDEINADKPEVFDNRGNVSGAGIAEQTK